MFRFARIAVPALLVVGSVGLLAGFGAGPAPAPAPGVVGADSYKVDPVHSSVVFRIRHSGVSNFYGRFNEFSGSFQFDPSAKTGGEFSFEVQTESVDTGNGKRDDHLRNADFFNSRQFPTISFASTGLEHVEGDMYRLTGDLTLQGETRAVTAELEWLGTGTGPTGAAIAGFEARFEVKRSDFGMTKYLAPDNSDNGGLGNTVTLIVSVEAVKG
jgi:polyisoprenoid-binding protein YceI